MRKLIWDGLEPDLIRQSRNDISQVLSKKFKTQSRVKHSIRSALEVGDGPVAALLAWKAIHGDDEIFWWPVDRFGRPSGKRPYRKPKHKAPPKRGPYQGLPPSGRVNDLPNTCVQGPWLPDGKQHSLAMGRAALRLFEDLRSLEAWMGKRWYIEVHQVPNPRPIIKVARRGKTKYYLSIGTHRFLHPYVTVGNPFDSTDKLFALFFDRAKAHHIIRAMDLPISATSIEPAYILDMAYIQDIFIEDNDEIVAIHQEIPP
jgi:hypothetical protein